MYGKKIALITVIFIIVLISLTLMVRPQPVKVILPSPNPTATLFCKKQDLRATMTLSPGAGNVYGTFMLTNTSTQTCEIAGGNFIEVHYNTGATHNIHISHIGQTQTETFNLPPNQSLYSQIHYPNGPQCSTETKPVNLSLTYQISPTENIEFTSEDNANSVAVQSCKLSTETTEIQIWNISNDPISQ